MTVRGRITALSLIVTGLLISLAGTGCSRKDMNAAMWEKVGKLDTEKTDTEMELERIKAEYEELQDRYNTLTAIDRDKQISAIAGVGSIKIGRRSGFYDKDDNGTNETLVVYVQPTDETGDTVKYPGTVTVQLWNLSGAEGGLLGEWTTEAAELKTLWANTIMTNYYRLDYPIDHILKPEHEDLTVKVTFVDFLTGNIVKTQHDLEQ